MKKKERDGWKAEHTGSPCSLNGSDWENFLESWCTNIARDSRKKQVKKIQKNRKQTARAGLGISHSPVTNKHRLGTRKQLERHALIFKIKDTKQKN